MSIDIQFFIVFIFYIICSLASAGFINAEWKHKYGHTQKLRRLELWESIAMGLVLGLLFIGGITVAYAMSGLGQYGWSLTTRRSSKEFIGG